MYFNYFDMLSGRPVLLNGVGHIRSPQLKDICSYEGIGNDVYNVYLNMLSWEKEHILKYASIMKYRGANKLNVDVFNAFDVATILKQTRELYRGMLSFFLIEKIDWDDRHRKFVVFSEDQNEQKHVVGEINRENFDTVRNVILQFNFIGLEKDDTPITHSSEKSKELWERAQKYLQEQAKNADTPKEKPEYNIGNVVSKLCAAHPTYNLLNIFDLTVFQLYDSFFQFGYLRSADLSERIFSNHGGDKFKFEDWLKPILNNM